MTRRLPPYGREMAERLAAGRPPKNGVWLYVGAGAWDRGRPSLQYSTRGVLILPPGEAPSAFRWPVASCDVLVLHGGGLTGSELRDLAVLLVRAGASLVTIVGAEQELGEPIWTARPEVRSDAA